MGAATFKYIVLETQGKLRVQQASIVGYKARQIYNILLSIFLSWED